MEKLKKIILVITAVTISVAMASCGGSKKKKSALEEASTSEAQTKILEEAKSQSKLDDDEEENADTSDKKEKTEDKKSTNTAIGGADAPTDIKVSDNSKSSAEIAYKSELVGVKFTLPEGYQMESDDVIKYNNEQMAASEEESQRNMRYEAIIQNPSENIQVIVCVDGNKGDFDEVSYLTAVGANYESATNAVIDRNAVYAMIAGKEYTTMKISMNNGNILYCVRKQDDNIIAFIISSPEGADDKVATVMNSFKPY